MLLSIIVVVHVIIHTLFFPVISSIFCFYYCTAVLIKLEILESLTELL